MIVGLRLLLSLGVLARSDSIALRSTARDTAVAAVATAEGPALRAASALPIIGVRVTPDGLGRWKLTHGPVVIMLVDGVPFASDGTSNFQMSAPPLMRNGELLLPLSALPALVARLGDDVHWSAERRELRLGAVRAVAAATAAVVAAAVAGTVAAPAPPAIPAPQKLVLPAATAATVATVATAGTAATAATVALSRTTRRQVSRHRVVVDAGHGGPDNGMKGPLGGRVTLYEKDITLAVAKKLAHELETRGIDVIMTRTTDTLIALSDRGRIANQRRGDLFISVHVNAANPGWNDPAGARGFETYFLSEAKTEDERRVAQIENASERFDSDGETGQADPLGFLIADMKQNEYLRESSDLASLIQARMRKTHPGPSRGVKQAGFRVLVTSFMPSVLVEIGFGSNPTEAAFISSAEGQRELAASVADAAVEYLAHYERRAGASLGGRK